jgi:AcrR family transcriptional regulator
MSVGAKPIGKDQVMAALVDATIDLIVERGLEISVRQIANRAGVNHGLVHAYFGDKRSLLRAAVDEINVRSSNDLDGAGFPRPDMASRRDGELAKALARIRLDAGEDLFSTHPVTTSWRGALASAEPALTNDQIDSKIAQAAALGLGWALYADHISELLGFDGAMRHKVESEIHELVARLGGLPTSGD